MPTAVSVVMLELTLEELRDLRLAVATLREANPDDVTVLNLSMKIDAAWSDMVDDRR